MRATRPHSAGIVMGDWPRIRPPIRGALPSLATPSPCGLRRTLCAPGKPIRQPCCSRISCARHVGGGSHRCAQLEHRAIVLPADADDGWRQLHELAYAFHVVPTTWKHDHYVVSTGCEVSPHCFGHVPRAVLLSLIRGDRHADHQEAVWTEYVSGPLGELQWLAGGKRSIGNIGGQRQHLRAVCGDDARVARLGYRYQGGTFHAH